MKRTRASRKKHLARMVPIGLDLYSFATLWSAASCRRQVHTLTLLWNCSDLETKEIHAKGGNILKSRQDTGHKKELKALFSFPPLYYQKQGLRTVKDYGREFLLRELTSGDHFFSNKSEYFACTVIIGSVSLV